MQEKQKVTLYLPDELHEKLKIRSALQGEAMSALAQRALEFYLSVSESVQASGATISENSSKSTLCLTTSVSQDVPAEVVANELATLCKALNAYHIAAGGNGLEISDWETLVAVRELVGV